MSDRYEAWLDSDAYRASRRRKAELIAAICGPRLADAGLVVDLGCGSGLIRKRLEELRGAPVYGFEIEPAALVDTTRVAVADLSSLPLRTGVLDLGIANHVYEHVESLDDFLAELARVLAPGGRVYLTAGNRFAVLEPHYRIPTLSWWPRSVSSRILRWTGRGRVYDDISFTTHRGLTRAARRNGIVLEDVTGAVLAEHRERYEGRLGRGVAAAVAGAPSAIRDAALRWLSPQWFFFARREDDR